MNQEKPEIQLAKKYGPPAVLLLLYFLQSSVTVLGNTSSLVVPFAFLWLMWTLNGIREALKVQRERLEKIEAR